MALPSDRPPAPFGLGSVQQLLIALGVATAYFVSGRAGLLLASEHDFATPLWPPAALAIVAALVWGRSASIGAGLGSFCVNVSVAGRLDAWNVSLLAGLGIGFGAAAQTELSRRLAGKFLPRPLTLDSAGHVLQFLLLVGPLGCLVNASVGNAVLLSLGLTRWDQLELGWLTWWAGDTLSVLALSPALLCFVGRPRALWRRRRLSVAAPLTLAFAVSVGLFQWASLSTERALRVEFSRQSDAVAARVSETLSDYIDILHGVRALFNSSSFVDRTEFSTFGQSILMRHPGLRAIEWLPRVPASERSSFERRAHEDGLEQFEFREWYQGGIRRAVERSLYYPIYYVEPMLGNDAALGVDLGSEARRLAMLERAEQTGEPAALAPVNLVQDSDRQSAFLVVVPVSRAPTLSGSSAPLEGFAVGAFRTADFLTPAVDSATREGINVELSTAPSVGPGEVLFSNLDTKSYWEHDVPIQLGGQAFTLKFHSTHRFIEMRREWTSWAVLSGGLFLIALLGVLLLSMSGETTRIQQQVEERTQSLTVAHRELKEQKEHAEAASAAKGEFLAHMSHEIRTPMNGVLGALELLADGSLSNEQGELVGTARHCGTMMLQLINDILDYSKLQAGRMVLDLQGISLNEMLRQTIAPFRSVASARGLTLDLGIADDLASRYEMDQLRLSQVLTNLLSNALKFTDRGGVHLNVKLGRVDAELEELLFVVVDSGIGVSADKLEVIFDNFVQADRSTTRKYGGTGLGLAISRELATLMGGELTLQSELGRGSTFTLSLLLRRVQDQRLTALEHEPRQLPCENSSRVVLLVDDNQTNLKIGSAMLRKLGCQVDVALGGQEALERLTHQDYDLVFMDWHMPEVDGLETARRIRLREQALGKGHVPIVALTANVMPGDRATCLAAGMDDYMTKPFRLQGLLEVLERQGAESRAGPRRLEELVS